VRAFLAAHGPYLAFWLLMACLWAAVHVGSIVWLARQIERVPR
jgi:hypothetical protein